MADAFIVRRGGGGGTKLFAAIGVKFSAGSTLTCTCVETGKVLTAKTTSDQTDYVFAVPNAGTWTVTDVTKGKSKDVPITKPGQAEIVNLAEFILFDAGDLGESGGWDKLVRASSNLKTFTVGSQILVLSDQYAGGQNMPSAYYVVCYAKKQQKLGDYSKLKVRFDETTATGFLAVNPAIPTTLDTFSGDYKKKFAATQDFETSSANQTVTLDVSSVNVDGYVAIIVNGTSGSSNPTAISKVWLE